MVHVARCDAAFGPAFQPHCARYAGLRRFRSARNGYDKKTVAQDIADTEAFRAQGKSSAMPILVFGGDRMTRGRGMTAMESWARVAQKGRGGVAEKCGHWIPEERPDFVAVEVLKHFGRG